MGPAHLPEPPRAPIGAAAILARRRRTDPLASRRWLPLQAEFLASEARVKQLRAGNQTIGKSTAAIAETIGRCTGRHPLAATALAGLLGPEWQARAEAGALAAGYVAPPIEWWTVCASWSQSLGIQAKIWDLLPKNELDPRTVYDRAAGFSPIKQPVILFKNGSVWRIKTAGQDALDWAGATIAGAHFDEPPRDPRQYIEALMRLEELGGTLLLSYTPINAPVDYLRRLVEDGQIEDHWRPLTPAELVPLGASAPLRARDGRPKDAAWIADRTRKIPAHERDVVLHGAWEGRAEGAYFGDVYDEERVLRPAPAEGRWAVRLGVDHGSKPGRQVAVLALTRPERGGVRVAVVGAWRPEGVATTEGYATGILGMLGALGWGWGHLDSAQGDRVHMPGSDSQKSNEDLEAALAQALGYAPGTPLRPPIEGAKRGDGRGAGSRRVGERWLYDALASGRLTVAPAAEAVRRALARYVGAREDDPEKDVIDALRYALGPVIFASEAGAGGVRFGA